MQKLRRENKELIKEILKIPYPVLLKEILERDYKDKKEILIQIDTFKVAYKKTGDAKAKEIVNELIKELEEMNSRIDRLKKVA